VLLAVAATRGDISGTGSKKVLTLRSGLSLILMVRGEP